MSGFLSGALGSLMQGGSGNTANAGGTGNFLSEAFASAGGVSGIVSKFQQAGLGDKVQSWVGQGGNIPMIASEVERVFPPEQIESWARAHGVPAEVASQVLAHLLPHAVDSQTPNGQVPDQAMQTSQTQGDGTSMAGNGQAGAGLSNFDFGGLVQRLMGGR